jgi:hypothetical protein
MEETSVDVREQFDASMFGKDMDAFDDFLEDIAPMPASPDVQIFLDQAMDVLGDDSFFSDDSDDEWSGKRRNFERPQHTGALEQMLFKSAAPKLIAKFGDPAMTEDSRGSPDKGIARFFPSKGADSLSKSEHGRKRDDLSKSEHGTHRKRDELSRSSCRKRNDLAIASEHTSRHRSSHEEKPLSRQRKLLLPLRPTSRRDTAEGLPDNSSSLRNSSLSPTPPASRRSSTSTATRRRRDELSQTEHCKPCLRRDALYSRNLGKNEPDRSRRSRSSIDLEEVTASTRRQGSDRSRSVDAKSCRGRSTSQHEATERGVGREHRPIQSIEQKPRRRDSSVEGPEKEHGSNPTGRRSSGRREHRGSCTPTDTHSMQRYRSHASSGGMVSKGSRKNLKTISEESRSMRRSTSTVDACTMRKPANYFDQLLFKTKRESVDARSMRKPTKDIDLLLLKKKRESKTKMLPKMGNSTWD